MQTNSYLPSCTKLKSKWIKEINNTTTNKKTDTLYLIEEKVGNTVEHIGIGDNSLNRRTPMAQALRSTIDKLINHETAKLL